MADNTNLSPPAPTTADGFLADRLHFWQSATKFMTNVVIALVVLLLFLWWWLV
jgi:hypothetical protein